MTRRPAARLLAGLILASTVPAAENALHRAVCELAAKFEIEKALEAGADPDARDSQGHTPLLVFLGYPSCRSYHQGDPPAEALRALLRAGADPNLLGSVDGVRVSAVHRAIARADGLGLNRLALILRHGGDIEAPDSAGETPLGRALRYGKPVQVAMLLGLGADFPGPVLGPARALELARAPRTRSVYGKREAYVDARIEEVVQAYATARDAGGLPEASDEDWVVIPESEDRPRLVLPRRLAAHLLVELGDPGAMRHALAAGIDPNVLWGGRTPAEYALELVEEHDEDYPAVLAELATAGAMIQCEGRSLRSWVRGCFAPLYDAGYGPAQDGVASEALWLGCLEGHCEDLSPLHDDLREGEYGPDMVDMGYVIEYGVETAEQREKRLSGPGTRVTFEVPVGYLRIRHQESDQSQVHRVRPNCPLPVALVPGDYYIEHGPLPSRRKRRFQLYPLRVEEDRPLTVSWPPELPTTWTEEPSTLVLPPPDQLGAPVSSGATLTDVPPSDPHHAALTRVVTAGILQTFDGRFRGEVPVNRFQMAAIASRLLEFLGIEKSPTHGAHAQLGMQLIGGDWSSHWAYTSVDRVLRAGVLRYAGRGLDFHGIGTLTHGDVADVMLALVDVTEGRDPMRRPVPHGPADLAELRELFPEVFPGGLDLAESTDRYQVARAASRLLELSVR